MVSATVVYFDASSLDMLISYLLVSRTIEWGGRGLDFGYRYLVAEIAVSELPVKIATSQLTGVSALPRVKIAQPLPHIMDAHKTKIMQPFVDSLRCPDDAVDRTPRVQVLPIKIEFDECG